VSCPALGGSQVRSMTVGAADMTKSGANHELGSTTSTSFS
jgi:hypothetical protein